jgi:NAD(P)H-nitrite reductase large subunit
MQHVVIIGNGIAGITTARHLRKLHSDYRITVISGETPHFFSRTALMYVYMGHMKFEHTKPYEDHFWAKNRIELVHDWVQAIDTQQKQIQLTNSTLAYDTLVLATGSKPNLYGWPGQNLRGVQGLYSYQDLQTMEQHTAGIQEAVVVGGGLIGIEMAEMLLSRNIRVTFLVREASFWNNVLPAEESAMLNRHIRSHHVDLRLGTELDVILDDGTGRVRAVQTKEGEEIAAQFVGITVGVSPQIALAQQSGLQTNRGVLVNEYLETSVPNVYAIGDCTELRNPPPGIRPVNQIWYTGRIMGETVAQTISGQPTAYQPGVFFNSAKFFDVEYQTYGNVPAQTPPDTASFWWEHPSGQIGMRLNYRQSDHVLTGVNTFGIRLRHASFETWLGQSATVEHVLEHLAEANFDPEFYRNHETAIITLFNQQNATALRPRAKRGLFANLFA